MKYPIVILHGWGKRGSDYSDLKDLLETAGNSVFCPDLPGFGEEPLTKKVMNLDDYIDFVLKFLRSKKINKAIFVGHSFGGRVSAKLAAKHPEDVEKLVLTGAPLIRQPLSIKKRILRSSTKIVKKIFGSSQPLRKVLYYLVGEWDYYKASSDIRETFKAIISEDLSGYLPFIKSPTLVVWGQLDTFVSPNVGRAIAKEIKSCKYIELRNETHRLPYENPGLFAEEIIRFIS